MNKIAIAAIIATLEKIQTSLPEAASAQSRQLVEERLTQYRSKKRQAPSSNVSNTDHARADILSALEEKISEQKGSPLGKRWLSDTIIAMAKARREAADDTSPCLNHEIFSGVMHELLYLRQQVNDNGDSATSALISEHIQEMVQRRGAYLDHPPSDIARAQAEVLERFNEHVREHMKAPLRKTDISSELLKWATFARQGMPLPDKRHAPQNAAS